MCKNTAIIGTPSTRTRSKTTQPETTPSKADDKLNNTMNTDLPADIQALEKDLTRRLEQQEPILWEVGKLGDYYQQWVFKTRTKKAIRFFQSEFLEKGTYSHWFVALCVYEPLWFWYWSMIGPNVQLLERAVFICIGLMCWPFIEHALHRFVFHVATTSYWGNSVHFAMHGQHHVCIGDPLRLVFPPHIAYILGIPFTATMTALVGFDRAICWSIGAGNGFMLYDMCHHALHHTHLKFLQRLRLHHLMHHYGNPDKYFGVSHEFTDEWFGTGKLGRKEITQAKDYEKVE